jgi:transketolase
MAQLVAQRDAFGQTLVELADLYPTMVVLDGDLANSTKADIIAKARPERFFQMGIAEQNMVGVAAGLAKVGFIPWVTTFAVFIASRALDQVRMVVAQTDANVKFAAGYSGLFTNRTGKTHQEVEDIAIMRAMPGMVVLCPADGPEARAAMHAAMRHQGPVYVRLVRDALPVIFPDDIDFEIGRGRVLREGGDISIIATGTQTVRALAAADLLAREGIEGHVLHLPTIKPLDEEAIVAAAERTGLVVTAEEHSILGGLGGAVAEVLSERRPTRLKRVGLMDVWGASGANEDLIEAYELAPRHVADAARALLAVGAPR